jgi:hypothetical protein
MKFEKGIAKKYRQSIDDAFDTILDKGNKLHRFLIENIVESEMIICVYPVAKVNASGICGVTNPNLTNERIQSERLDLTEAFKEVFITFAEETIDNGGQRGCEGTLVHEGRHAYDFARAIASFSNADNEKPFNPTLYEIEWEGHISAAQYMLQIGKDEYIQEGLDLLVLGELNGKHYVNDKGIKKRLKNSYGLEEGGNLGLRVSEMMNLKMRSKGIIKSLFG